MGNSDYIRLLEEENRSLKTKLQKNQEKLDKTEKELLVEKKRLQDISENIPNGILLVFEANFESGKINTLYLSKKWEQMSNVSVKDTLQDTDNVFKKVHPDDLSLFLKKIFSDINHIEEINMEIRYFFEKDDLRWMQVSVHPRVDEANLSITQKKVIMEGYMIDITEFKKVELELRRHHEELETLVDERTEDLKNSNDRYLAINEELEAFNEELQATTEELQTSNEELYNYKDKLELMVEKKTSEIREQQAGLEKLNNRQTVLINILNIMQYPDNMQQAIDSALAIIGNSTGVSRVFIVEKNSTSTTVSLTHEWCNIDVKESKQTIQNLPIEFAQRWFDLLKDGDFRCFKTLETLDDETIAQLEGNDVKSIAVLPLTNYGAHYGFIGYDDCIAQRDWNMDDIELLKSVSHIISITTQRFRAEENLVCLSRRQALLIKVLNIVQSTEDLQQAMKEAIAEGGKFANVSRVHIFEKSPDGKTISNTMEWCNTGIESVVGDLQNIPIELVQHWFEMFETTEYFSSENTKMFTPELVKMLSLIEVRSTIVFPLASGDTNYGLVVFDECNSNRVWEENEIEMMNSLSQIISVTHQRNQVKNAMELSYQTMSKVLDNLTAKIVVTDFKTREVLFANRNIKNSLGIDPIGQECWKVLQFEQNKVCDFCPKKYLVDENNISTGVYHYEHYNEQFKQYIAVDFVSIEWIDGRLAQLEIGTDITDLKKAEIELVKAKEKAEEADKLKTAFIANMSHEVRTPLNAIVGFTNALTMENCTSDDFSVFKNLIQLNTELLLNIFNNIMDFSRLEGNSMNFTYIDCDIVDLCESVISTIKHANRTNAECKFVSPVKSFILHTDMHRLQQVLLNLLSNSAKFALEGSIHLTFKIEKDKNRVVFSVTDTGCGIPKDKQKSIFKRFGKLNEHIQGTGLGLPISRLTINKLGGDIWVDPDYKDGARLVFTHPIN